MERANVDRGANLGADGTKATAEEMAIAEVNDVKNRMIRIIYMIAHNYDCLLVIVCSTSPVM